MALLAQVSDLAKWLGRPLSDPSPEFGRAEFALEMASVRAATLAQHPEWTAATVPGDVKFIVLAAARRLYQNPNGYVVQQAGGFMATQAAGTVTTDVFNAGEKSALLAHRPLPGMWVIETTRGSVSSETGFVDCRYPDGSLGEQFPLNGDGPC